MRCRQPLALVALVLPSTFAAPLYAAGAAKEPARAAAADPVRVAQTSTKPPATAKPPAPKPASAPKESDDDLPLSRDDLFGSDLAPPKGAAAAAAGTGAGTKTQATETGLKLRGFLLSTAAYSYDDPGRWSRFVNRLQVGSSGNLGANARWKVDLRFDVDPIYFSTDRYPQAVKEDLRFNSFIREAYLDTAAGGWDFRLGRQQIVWGEVVGLFFADVVSARDLRDFILPQFDVLRTPQWAIRAERFGKRFNTELVWIPVATYDEIGRAGAEFYPFPAVSVPGVSQVFNDAQRPANNLSNGNAGIRISSVARGWDMAGFAYTSMDASPSFYREITPGPVTTVTYTPRHDRIWQAGATVSKDLGGTVVRGELVYTANRRYNVARTDAVNGVVPIDTLAYILSADFVPWRDTRLNLQAFNTHFYQFDPTLLLEVDKNEWGVSALLSAQLSHGIEPEILVVQSLQREEGMIRPRLTWRAEKNLRLSLGVDIFHGPQRGYFGRFASRDRVYAEMRYNF